MSSKGITGKINFNKENDGGPLNLLRKVQKTRREQIEKKISNRSHRDQSLKENRNYGNKQYAQKIKNDDITKLHKQSSFEPEPLLGFRERETEKTMKNYSQEMLQDMKNKQARYWPINFLDNHGISPNVRAKMIDWMIEVLCSYKCTDMTFFIAVNYMDMYFKKTKAKHELNDLHLVGISAMYLATKYEEICPLRISIMQSKISHGKFTKAEIRQKETEIIAALDFYCSSVTTLHFIEFGIQYIRISDRLPKRLYNHLQKLSIYIAKMTVHEYDLLNRYNQSEIASACVYIGMKIIQQLDTSFKIDSLAYDLRSAYGINDSTFFACSQEVLDLAKGFETKYPALSNLSKFHSFSMDDPSAGLSKETSDEKEN